VIGGNLGCWLLAAGCWLLAVGGGGIASFCASEANRQAPIANRCQKKRAGSKARPFFRSDVR